jgi:hypothetical protein
MDIVALYAGLARSDVDTVHVFFQQDLETVTPPKILFYILAGHNLHATRTCTDKILAGVTVFRLPTGIVIPGLCGNYQGLIKIQITS